jgi:hypothetical protein
MGLAAKSSRAPRTAKTPRKRIDLGDDCLLPTEFVLDGFMPVGVSVVAGAWGAGKSTNLIPLMASVAHLTPKDWGFHPDLQRYVIWITEAPEQARDTLWSLRKAEGSADWQTFKDWFHIYASRREEPGELANELKALVDELTYSTHDGFDISPVVVLDTTTANIDLENENDNAQVGAAISALKQALRGASLVLIGHTPKAMLRAVDPAEMTFRGAGAWEAEAAATYVLGWDEQSGTRFLALRKARFTPTYREINFGFESGSVMLDTPWGEPQSKSYLHGVPTKSNGEARKAARREILEEQRQEAKAKAESELQRRILATIRQFISEGRLPTRATIRAAVKADKSRALAAVRTLIEGGVIREHALTREQVESMSMELKAPWPGVLLPVEVEFNLFCRTVKENHQ